jgi:hypothetical protein
LYIGSAIDPHSLGQLWKLDADLRAVRRRSEPHEPDFKWLAGVPRGDGTRGEEDRRWQQNLFEMSIKARALVAARRSVGRVTVEFDVPLPQPSKRDVDIVLTRKDRRFYLECSDRSDTNEDRVSFDEWTTDEQTDPTGNFKSVYERVSMVYDKVYDKLAARKKDKSTGHLFVDPSNPQMSSAHPNVLVLNFSRVFGPLEATDEAVRWSLDELLAVQPRSGSPPPGIPDVSLSNYLQQWPQQRDALLQAPRFLGGIMTFDHMALSDARVNYNANRSNRITNSEMAWLEAVLGGHRGWEKPRPSFRQKQAARRLERAFQSRVTSTAAKAGLLRQLGNLQEL